MSPIPVIKEVKAEKTSTTLDLAKILENARTAYGKKEKGLSLQLSTGKTIIRPSADDDFVLWPTNDETNLWKDLTGLRGIPYGRIIQFSGKPDSGKSTALNIFMVSAQKTKDCVVILWDSERKFSSFRFENHMGGDPAKLLVIDTNNILNGIRAIKALIKAIKDENPKTKILLAVDSLGAMVNTTEDNEEDDAMSKQPGVSAKENSYMIKQINKLMNRYLDRETNKETICCAIVNQTYASIGMGAPTQIEKGGNEVYYLSSVIIQMSRKQDLTRVKGGQKYKYGIVSRAKVKKNHLFEGIECIAEMDVVVSAGSILSAEKVKSFTDIEGWNGPIDKDFSDEE